MTLCLFLLWLAQKNSLVVVCSIMLFFSEYKKINIKLLVLELRFLCSTYFFKSKIFVIFQNYRCVSCYEFGLGRYSMHVA